MITRAPACSGTTPAPDRVQDFYRALFTRLILLRMLHPQWTVEQVEVYLLKEGQRADELTSMLAARDTTLPAVWARAGRFAVRNQDGLLGLITP